MNADLLPVIWFAILCLEIVLYIILDGADLGIGILSLIPQKEGKRGLMLHTIGPIWDANETWLVIAGGTLFGAFPLVYAILLSALYIPIMLMLFGLILRAASFEFREYGNKRMWEIVFGLASLLAVLGQGFAAGGLLGGIKIVHNSFAGGPFDWATPLTFFITVGIAMSYIVVGYAYIIRKTDYELEKGSFYRVIVATGVTFAAFLTATILLPQMHFIFLERWTTEPTRSVLFGIAGLIGVFSFLLAYYVLTKTHLSRLYGVCLCIFISAFAGMLVGVYPYIIPPTLTLAMGASSPQTLRFMLFGVGPLLPIVLTYNWYMFYVFRRGKGIDREEGY